MINKDFAKRYEENYRVIYRQVFGRDPEPFCYNNPSPTAYDKHCEYPKFDLVEDFKFKVEEYAKPCPFCGSSVCGEVHNECHGHGEFYDIYYIVCHECHLSFMCFTPLGKKLDVMLHIDRWNNRI